MKCDVFFKVFLLCENSSAVKTCVNEDDFSTCFNIDTSNDNSGLDDKNVGDMPSITKFDCVLCKMSFDNVPAFVQHVNSHEPSGDVGENVGLNTDIRLQGNYKTIYICSNIETG
jgi:hypothetical protein